MPILVVIWLCCTWLLSHLKIETFSTNSICSVAHGCQFFFLQSEVPLQNFWFGDKSIVGRFWVGLENCLKLMNNICGTCRWRCVHPRLQNKSLACSATDFQTENFPEVAGNSFPAKLKSPVKEKHMRRLNFTFCLHYRHGRLDVTFPSVVKESHLCFVMDNEDACRALLYSYLLFFFSFKIPEYFFQSGLFL